MKFLVLSLFFLLGFVAITMSTLNNNVLYVVECDVDFESQLDAEDFIIASLGSLCDLFSFPNNLSAYSVKYFANYCFNYLQVQLGSPFLPPQV